MVGRVNDVAAGIRRQKPIEKHAKKRNENKDDHPCQPCEAIIVGALEHNGEIAKPDHAPDEEHNGEPIAAAGIRISQREIDVHWNEQLAANIR